MKFKFATGFDREKQDEEFTTVELSDKALQDIVVNLVNRMEYAQRNVWLGKLVKAGEAEVVTN
jgi:hypothetical protein